MSINHDELRKHIAQASAIVETWPAWEQTSLEWSLQPTKSNPRPYVDNSKDATMKDGDVVINERGGRQAYISARFDLIPPEGLRLLAQCVGRGARVRGVDNWKLLDIEDNIGHAVNHLNEWRAGDRSEMHLVHAMTRTLFAVCQAIEAGDQPDQYSHPEDERIARNG